MASPKVPCIFVRISVGLHVTCTLHWCVLVYIYTLHVAMVTVVVYYVYMYYALSCYRGGVVHKMSLCHILRSVVFWFNVWLHCKN